MSRVCQTSGSRQRMPSALLELVCARVEVEMGVYARAAVRECAAPFWQEGRRATAGCL